MFGSYTEKSKQKKGFTLNRPVIETADLGRLINSDQVQSIVRPIKDREVTHSKLKVNPLKNKDAMAKLNPMREELNKRAQKDQEIRHQERVGKMTAAFKKARKERSKAGKAFYKDFVDGLKEAYVPVDAALRPPHSSDEEEEDDEEEDDEN